MNMFALTDMEQIANDVEDFMNFWNNMEYIFRTI